MKKSIAEVKQLKKLHIHQLDNKNQFYIAGNGFDAFQSYSSLIAIYSDGVLTLGRNWDYSHTTLKHLYIFIIGYTYAADISSYLYNSKNKRKTIQKLIDEGIIKYDPRMA